MYIEAKVSIILVEYSSSRIRFVIGGGQKNNDRQRDENRIESNLQKIHREDEKVLEYIMDLYYNTYIFIISRVDAQ